MSFPCHKEQHREHAPTHHEGSYFRTAVVQSILPPPINPTPSSKPKLLSILVGVLAFMTTTTAPTDDNDSNNSCQIRPNQRKRSPTLRGPTPNIRKRERRRGGRGIPMCPSARSQRTCTLSLTGATPSRRGIRMYPPTDVMKTLGKL